MTAADLLALAERVEREEASRELDAAIGRAIGWRQHPLLEGFSIAPSWTSSVDAADTLRPAGMSIVVTLADRWIVQLDGGAHVGIAETEAQARVAAALRARAAPSQAHRFPGPISPPTPTCGI